MSMRVFRGALLVAVILSAWAVPARAQAIGSIFGKVTDASGGVLPGVNVTVTGPALQAPLTATTAAGGEYQFPSVPIGTFSVTFELSSFKKALRPNVVITTGFNAQVDQKMEIGQMTEEVTVSSAAPVVDTKKTATGATFDKDILEKIPTARDPWQIVNMAPGVQAGLNVGGSASGQQVSLAARGTSANVQWNLEGGSITDLSSNSSPSYFDFDSFEQIQVTTGGGDVSVQSSGLSINLVTKSGSNVFKGTVVGTFENDKTQGNNVTQALFATGANGFLSGNPLQKITNYSAEAGGPILKNKLWYWGAWDSQLIDVGVINFFDATKGSFCTGLIAAQKAGSAALASLVTYDKLSQIQNCLATDKTTIKDLNWKFNYQINAANKIQYLFTSDNKYRNHRDSSSTTALESSHQQTSDAPLKLPLPTYSITHTLIASDKLVFNNQVTYVGGGFFLDYQDVPPQGSCAQSRYTGSDSNAGYTRDPSCGWNTQPLVNRTTGVLSRAPTSIYQTTRHSWEAKTDGTYFLTHTLGGDHSLKFGLGYRKNPIQTFSHYSSDVRPTVECVGNTLAGCGDGTLVPAGSAAGVIPFQAVLYRDQLLNNDWWTYNGYLQDSYSRGKVRLNGGLRYDWQNSKYLGGCVEPNSIMPGLLPSQCDKATQADPVSGKKIQAFGNWSPRMSATYDLFGNGKTSIHANGSYFYDTHIVLANSLSGLFSQPALTWGPNLSSGACNPASNGCWTDANHDGLVQASELIGSPATPNVNFVNGVFNPAGNIVDPSAKIGRTREAVVGFQHELVPNLAVGVDYIYRKYDRGTTTYVLGFQPGGPNFPTSQIYTGPLSYTDPVTGLSAPYFVVCATCTRPTGQNITVTNPNYRTYSGVDITATKRYSNRWQMTTALTLQTNPSFFPVGSAQFNNPTGENFSQGISTIAKYVYKANGSYTFPWDITGSANYNFYQGATRTLSINGPGSVFGGVGQTNITYNTLTVANLDNTRVKPVSLLDAGVQKSIKLGGGSRRIKLTFDGFNLFNVNTILTYASGNESLATFVNPATIVAPRVFRFGASFAF